MISSRGESIEFHFCTQALLMALYPCTSSKEGIMRLGCVWSPWRSCDGCDLIER